MSFEWNQEGDFPADRYLGRRLGAYELVERIGTGGMGAVYRARSTGSEPEVAIKVIKPGMDSSAILRRFDNERRILGSLDHPNIARLLDAGTTADGLPYFVMEFISGQPIHRYCDALKLSVPDRLRLFLKVCSAVECAHEIHIVHRDIKPENILVTGPSGRHPDEPVLLDFGIAKILDPTSLAVSQQVTVTLGRVMTPHYASPEQARGEPVTPASDIYSLGVLLYELLTGRSPYNPDPTSPQSLVRAICLEPPRPPSYAVGRAFSRDSTTQAIAANRGTDPKALRDSLAGDLDAILGMALEKDAKRRYASVALLSADIQRHLDGVAVQARQFRRRYAIPPVTGQRRMVGAGVLILALLVAGFVFERRLKSRVSMRPSVAVLGFENLSHQPSAEWLGTALTEMVSTELSAGERVRTVPGELVSRVKLELALPNAQTLAKSTLTRLRRSLGTDYVVLGSYLALGEGSNLQVRVDLRLQDANSGNMLASVSETRPSAELSALVARSAALLRRQLGAGEQSVAASQRAIPEGDEAARNYSAGLERLRTFDTLAARDLLHKAVQAAPDHAPSHAALAAASSLLGYDQEARDEARKALELSSTLPREARLSIEGRFFETTAAWDKAVATFQTLRKEYPDDLEYGLRLAAAQTQAGQGRAALETIRTLHELPSAASDPRVDLAEGEAALAASDLARAGAASQRAARSGSDQGFRTLAAQAHLLGSRISMQSGDPQRALASAAEAQQLYLAAGQRQGVAMALNESAGVLNQRGDVPGARARYEEALAVCRAIGDQTCIGTDLDSLGVLRRRQGDLHGALEMHRQALEIRRNVGDRAGIATSLYNTVNVLESLGDLPGAAQAAAESLELRNQLGLRRTSALAMSRLGNIRRREGSLADALSMSTQAVATLKAIGDRGGTAMAQVNLGLVLFDQGDLARSRSELEAALAIRRQQRDKNNMAQALAALAVVALAQDRLSEATNLIGESISLRQELGEAIALAQSRLLFAEILIEQGRPPAAEEIARAVRAVFHGAAAAGWEAEAELAIASAELARGDLPHARASLDSLNRLLRGVKDASLLLRRDMAQARLEFAAGHAEEAAAILKRASGDAGRSGLRQIQLELRLAMVQTGGAADAQLVADAGQAGFHLIERKAGAPARPAAPAGLP